MKKEKRDMREFPDDLPMPEYDERREHPTFEQLLIRNAMHALTAKQKTAWEYHIFEKYTLDKIGQKMGISHQAVSAHIRAAEKRIRAFCKANEVSYRLILEHREERK